MKENPTEYRQFPGETLWEQVKIDGEHRFVFYRPPNDVSPDEAVSYDTTNPGEVTEEYSLVYKPLAKCPWPLAGEIVKPSEDIWAEVHGFIYRHADLPDERLYDVVTAWIFCTWILERWISVPYLHLIGPKKVGKQDYSKSSSHYVIEDFSAQAHPRPRCIGVSRSSIQPCSLMSLKSTTLMGDQPYRTF